MTDTLKIFDEAAFFHTRPGLSVDYFLEHCVGLENRPTRGASVLQCRQLEHDTTEGEMFGRPDSEQHAKTLEDAVDLVQIAGMIEAQKNGEVGELLTNGRDNIFPVRGIRGSLVIVYLHWNDGGHRWYLDCRPFAASNTWHAGCQVISN